MVGARFSLLELEVAIKQAEEARLIHLETDLSWSYQYEVVWISIDKAVIFRSIYRYVFIMSYYTHTFFCSVS